MKLAELSNGPDWVIWFVFAVIAVLSVVLLTGRGSRLISGLLENVLPAGFVYVLPGVIVADVIVVFIVGNTFCRK